MSYELTRRDALAALAAAGVAGGAALSREDGADPGLDDHDVATLVAVAEVVYPSEVEGVPAFVERYVVGRAQDRPAHAEGISAAVARLDEYARDWRGERFVDLDRAARDELLRAMGLDTAEPDPEGADPGRLRFYLVNELLYALYTTPTGGELVGIENPQGHPGGLDSYRRSSPADRR